jgi:hypothetical protein
MSLIKIALNAFTKNWQNLSNTAKQTIGQSGAIRSERKFIMGHIEGNKNILQNMRNKGINISHIDSQIYQQAGGMPLTRNSGVLINAKQAFSKTKEILPQIGVDTNLGKETSKSGRYFTTQVHRHEMREVESGVNKLRNLENPKVLEKKVIPRIYNFVRDFNPQDTSNLNKVRMNNFNDYMLKNLKEMQPLEEGKFLGHHSKSIPVADIKQSLKMPNNLGKSMLNMRLAEHPYLG